MQHLKCSSVMVFGVNYSNKSLTPSAKSFWSAQKKYPNNRSCHIGFFPNDGNTNRIVYANFYRTTLHKQKKNICLRESNFIPCNWCYLSTGKILFIMNIKTMLQCNASGWYKEDQGSSRLTGLWTKENDLWKGHSSSLAQNITFFKISSKNRN